MRFKKIKWRLTCTNIIKDNVDKRHKRKTKFQIIYIKIITKKARDKWEAIGWESSWA